MNNFYDTQSVQHSVGTAEIGPKLVTLIWLLHCSLKVYAVGQIIGLNLLASEVRHIAILTSCQYQNIPILKYYMKSQINLIQIWILNETCIRLSKIIIHMPKTSYTR